MIDIKKFRKENRLTQVEFGKRLGYTHAYISNVENGKEPVTDNFLNKLHEIFGVEVEEFKSYNQKTDEPVEGYVTEWQRKYLELQVEHFDLMRKYTSCLEEKDALKNTDRKAE